MTRDFELRRELYLKELLGSRKQIERRREYMTFFYVERPIDNQAEDEVQYAIKYNNWRLK